MAAKRPWYQRNGAAIVMGTLHMPSSDHKWAYSTIIDMLNDRGRALPDDPGFICGLTGLSRKKWAIVREYLLNDRDAQGETRLYLDDAGDLTNPRFERERAQRDGDHARAVEAGREGGKKSAALRARQGDLDLDESQGEQKEDQAIYRADKRAINAPKVARRMKDKVAINDQPPLKTNEKIQPPPQATRARERASDIRYKTLTQPTESLERCEDDAIDDELRALYHACSEAAAFRPGDADQQDRAIAQIRKWRDDGIDFDRVVLPVIAEAMAASRDPTSSFARFNRQVRHEQARIVALNGKAPARSTTDQPLVDPIAETARCHAFRRDLLKALGVKTYVKFANLVQLIDDGSETLEVVENFKVPSLQLIDDDRAPLIAKIAKAHGFTEIQQ